MIAAPVATINAVASPSQIVSTWSTAAPRGIVRSKGTIAIAMGSGSALSKARPAKYAKSMTLAVISVTSISRCPSKYSSSGPAR